MPSCPNSPPLPVAALSPPVWQLSFVCHLALYILKPFNSTLPAIGGCDETTSNRVNCYSSTRRCSM